MTIDKEIIKPILFTIVGFVCALLLMNGCNDKPPKIEYNYKPFYDSLSKKYVALHFKNTINEIEINKQAKKVDSLNLIKMKFYPKYIEVKTIAKLDTNCLGFIAYADSLENLNVEIIKQQDSAIVAYKASNDNKDAMIEIQNSQIAFNLAQIENQKQLAKLTEKSHKKELRKQKAKTWIVGIIGASALASFSYLLIK